MENGKWQMANVSGNVNGNEWQVPALYKQHVIKTLTILDVFPLEIILFGISLRYLSLEAILVV